MKIKYLLCLFLGFLLGSVAGGFIGWFLSTPFISESGINYQTLRFNDIDRKIYATAMVWGITGNHEEVRLCTLPQIDFRTRTERECLVFHTDEIFYRKTNPNKLQIYVISHAVPANQPEKLVEIEIEIHKLKNFDAIADYKMNFEKYGLQSIAAP